MLDNEITVGLDGCSVRITTSSQGIVVNILTPSGKRLTGTWASTEELISEKRIDRSIPDEIIAENDKT